MSDPRDDGRGLEHRLAEALRAGSDEAPDALGLADGARTRARARRRTRAAAVAATAVAALAVPVAVVALGGGDEERAPVAGDPSSQLEPVESGRWETWHELTVLVPEEWEYGDLATWCADGGSAEEPRVGRPGGPTPMILCTPSSSWGITFQDIEMAADDEPFDWPVVQQTGEGWPPGTYVGAHGEDGVLVTVAGPDAEQVLDVLATAEAYGRADPAGCGPRVDDPVTVPEGAMAVCRYDTGGELEQSEALLGGDAEAAAEMLDGTVDGELDCQPSPGPGQVIRMYDGERDVRIELDGACTVVEGQPSGIADADVLWWALSPGWTGDATGLPIGSELRSRDKPGP